MAHQNIEAYEDKIYCQLPEGLEGRGGYKPDILVDNLSERELNLFICRICNGIKKESCFKEHRDRPDSLVNTEEIRQEIGNIKVSCPLNKAQCGWIGKLSEFEIHINICVEREKKPIEYYIGKVFENQLKLFQIVTSCCCLSCLCWFFLILIFYRIITNVGRQIGEANNNIFLFNKDLDRIEANIQVQFTVVNTLHDRSMRFTEFSQQSIFQRLRLDKVEQDLICFQDKVTQIGDNLKKSTENSFLISTFIDSFRELHESYQKIRLNPYSPQKGVIWNIYQVSAMLEKPTELTGPEFYVNEYKFQPTIDTLRDGETCVTFCIALVNCNHYDKVKWPMELEESGFRVFLHSHKHSSDTLNFEINEDNKSKFEKPINEKNKPLCKQWLCKTQLMNYVENDALTMYILNANTTQPDSP